MGLPHLFGFCLAILFTASVSAANIIDLGPSDYKNFGPNGAHTGAGIRSSFGQTVRLPPTTLNTLTVTRNPVVPYASAAARMRPFTAIHPASAAASAAITGLFLAMEWYFDEEIGEWSVREVESIPPVNPDDGWEIRGGVSSCTYPNTGVRYDSPAEACEAAASCYSPPKQSFNVVEVTMQPDGSGNARCQLSNPGSTTITLTTPGFDCPVDAYFDADTGSCQRHIGVPVIEGEFSRLAGELPNLPAERVAEGTGDAQRRYGEAGGYTDTQITGPESITGPTTTSTSTDPATGSTTTTETTTQTNISYGDTTITTTNTTTTNTYVDGQHTKTETTTETPGELPVESPGSGAGIEWPAFCDWAVKVCDWLDWTQEDPGFEDPDLPVPIDEDFYREKNINFGSKSCPPDYDITVPFINTTVAVPMQPFCDFAGIIYFMVMTSAYIYAAYISVGVARNG